MSQQRRAGRCHSCGHTLEVVGTVHRRDECEHCEAPLHCCLNCSFHDPYAPNQCREPTAEYVVERAKPNFCDHFTFGRKQDGRYGDAAEESKRRLEALFSAKK